MKNAMAPKAKFSTPADTYVTTMLAADIA